MATTTRHLQVLSQRDPRWANQRLGTTDGATIGQYGCLLTCFSMLAAYYGHPTNPAQLDDILTQRGLYVDGDLLTDDALHQVYPSITFMAAHNYQTVAADLQLLKKLCANPQVCVIVEVDFDHIVGDGIQTHFVVAVSYDGHKLMLADPWYGDVVEFGVHYGDNPGLVIQKLICYSGKPGH